MTITGKWERVLILLGLLAAMVLASHNTGNDLALPDVPRVQGAR